MRPPTSRRKWLVLGVYVALVAASEMLCTNLCPLFTELEQRYRVSAASLSWLSACFPVVYVLTSVPVGAASDRFGYPRMVALGSALLAAFGLQRAASSAFGWVLVAQCGIALGSILVVNNVSKLVLDWFDERESAAATGVVFSGLYAGSAIAMGATLPLASALGTPRALAVFAAAMGALALGAPWLVGRNAHPEARRQAPAAPARPLGRLELALLSGIAFCGLGVFNALVTWLEPLLANAGVAPAEAGLAGAAMIAGGIAGNTLVPRLARGLLPPKALLAGSSLAAFFACEKLCDGGTSLRVLWGALAGFCLLPGVPLVLDLATRRSGEGRAGRVTGMLSLAGNLGAIAVILIVPFADEAVGRTARLLVGAPLLLGAALAAALPPARLDPSLREDHVKL